MTFLHFLAVCAALALSTRMCEGSFKQWLPNTNFANDKNWNTGHVPCGDVSVKIPEIAPQIYVQLDTTIKELILPLNIELVLGDGLNLVFSDSDDKPSNCQNPTTGEVSFLNPDPQTWFDPDNWCPVDAAGGKCNGNALLDTEQVPCRNDDVVFPLTSSYYVNLDSGYNITVGSLKVAGVDYSTQTFSSYLSTDLGKRTFPPPSASRQSSVSILGDAGKCNDVTGCACGNDAGQMKKKICDLKSKKCDTPFCSEPLIPTGSCCSLCGAILEITYGSGFKFTFFRNSIQSDFIQGKPTSESVSYIVSKRSDNRIQMVLTDSAGNNSIPFANTIKKALDTDVANKGVKYGITSVSLQVSHGAFRPPEPRTGGKLDGGQIAGIVISLLVIVAIVLVIAFFVYRRRTSTLAFDIQGLNPLSAVRDRIRRFRQPKTEFGASISFRDPTNVSATLQGIDNPLYGSSSRQGAPISDVEMPRITSYDQGLQPSAQATQEGFDNPLYDQVKESAFFADPSVRMNPTFDPDNDNM